MGMYLVLAWRNLWRNRRRSLISISSILFAVILALVTRSMQLGTYRMMIDNAVSFQTGYLQVHDEGYWDRKSINRSFLWSDSLEERIASIPRITGFSPRLELFALLSAGHATNGAFIQGIAPEREITRPEEKLVEGEFLRSGDRGIVLAEGLARQLGAGVGDTVVILGQGYHGVTAAGKHPVRGIVEFVEPELNRRQAYLTLPSAQQLTLANDRITSLAIMIEQQEDLLPVKRALEQTLSNEYEVMTWEQMMPEMVQSIEADNASGIIILFIIYVVIGFGILGTILMMTMERLREFSMMIAVGMKRGRLRLIVLVESLLLTFSGVAAGTALGIPLLMYLKRHPWQLEGALRDAMLNYGFEPVIPFSTDPAIFLWQAVTVLIIALVVSLYPLWRITRMDPVDELHAG